MKKRDLSLILIISFNLFCVNINIFSQDYNLDNIPNPKTSNANVFISNPDNIISSSAFDTLNKMLYTLQKNHKAEIAIVAVNSIGDNDITTFGVELFKRWQIGEKTTDNGLLILFVMNQKRVRFEVGYGLEGVLPDAICKRIQNNYMLPFFRQGNYDRGIIEAVKELSKYLRENSFNPKLSKKSNSFQPMFLLIMFAVSVFSFLFLFNKKRIIANNSAFLHNKERYSAMGTAISQLKTTLFFVIMVLAIIFFFLDVGFINVLAVIFSYLGIIPSYIFGKKSAIGFRKQLPLCDRCNKSMVLLSETEDDKFLTLSQVYEEKINSADYDVFLCKYCNHNIINKYEGKAVFDLCPKCGTRDLVLVSTQIVQQPNYISNGLKMSLYHCSFCGYEQKKSYKIPPLNAPIMAGSGGGFSGGSFGGGASGGGGATSGW